MSTNVFIACDDHILDQYVTVPIVQMVMASIGKPQAKVKPISSPHLQGEAQMFKEACGILERYGPIADVVVFIVDVDCADGRDGKMHKVERLAGLIADQCVEFASRAIVIGAQHEIEVWALWGVAGSLGATWNEVRDDCHPKEAYFHPQVTASESRSPDKGRRRLTSLSLDRGWQSLSSGCPELADLAQQIAARLAPA